jgi:prolyl oligopeptidase
MRRFLAALVMLALPLTAAAGDAAGDAASEDDPFLWLEEVEGEKALAWVERFNDRSQAELEAVPVFDEIRAENLAIYDSKDRIPMVAIQGPFLYNFWQDADHVRGIWRRTSLEQYRTANPAWETVLDIDALAEAEGENWVWKGASCLYPDYRLCMVGLSRGGADATVRREFDAFAKRFVEDGFSLPEAKSRVSWRDENTLWVGTDFGEGSLTTSGYPRFVKLWSRGTSLENANTVFEGSVDDVAVTGYSDHTPEGRFDIISKTPAFFRGTSYLVLGDRLVKIDIPEDADFLGVFKNQMIVTLRTDWEVGGTTYPQDAALTIDLDRFLQGERDFELLFEPSERVTFGGLSSTRNQLLMTTLDNVRGRLYRVTPSDDGWMKREIPLPGVGSAGIGSTSDYDDTFFFGYTDFLTPTSLYLAPEGGEPVKVKSMPEFFVADGMKVVQHEATSGDGTRIPYFLVTPKGFVADGSAPTMLTAYGGFEIPSLPQYSGVIGTAWLERGGVYVLANIRGGGEFGPRWHQAALREKRQRNFDDLIAVAEDLVARKITSPEHLGIEGGSQGGLLVGATFVQRPDLFKAVVCAVPLLDMKRYHKLLAGASWMAEYGNPDTEDWQYIKKWSPYQNLDPEVDYPKVFFYTSTRDDRVHPGHARKMVARMTEMDKPVYYFENTEGGHAAGANNEQRAYMWALAYAYLWKMLG